MSQNDIKLALNKGVELKATSEAGVSAVIVLDQNGRFDLTWDRFLRLHNTAEAVKQSVVASTHILDVGGFDGALAMFLPGYSLDVIDPITTGGTGHSITTGSYDAVVSIDALEHVPPSDRESFTRELCNASRKDIFINFPGQQSVGAQQLVFELTDNPLVKEHVIWELPDKQEVKNWMVDAGFEVIVTQHTSVAQWISQYLLQTISPDAAAKVNRHLVENYLAEPVGTPLYDLLIGRRMS